MSALQVKLFSTNIFKKTRIISLDIFFRYYMNEEWKHDMENWTLIKRQPDQHRHTNEKERGGERCQSEEECRVTHWMVILWERVTYLKRWNVRVGNVAVHILDFWEVLLRHVHQLRSSNFIGEPREVVFRRRGIIILIPVLYTGKERRRDGETEESREN